MSLVVVTQGQRFRYPDKRTKFQFWNTMPGTPLWAAVVGVAVLCGVVYADRFAVVERGCDHPGAIRTIQSACGLTIASHRQTNRTTLPVRCCRNNTSDNSTRFPFCAAVGQSARYVPVSALYTVLPAVWPPTDQPFTIDQVKVRALSFPIL